MESKHRLLLPKVIVSQRFIMNERDSDYPTRPDAAGHLKVLDVLRRWDPIGVVEFSPDEYDIYAPDIVRMLDRGCSVRELTRWLSDIRSKQMGLGSSTLFLSQDKAFATELVAFWDVRKRVDKERQP